jgi:hypothetical protein
MLATRAHTRTLPAAAACPLGRTHAHMGAPVVLCIRRPPGLPSSIPLRSPPRSPAYPTMSYRKTGQRSLDVMHGPRAYVQLVLQAPCRRVRRSVQPSKRVWRVHSAGSPACAASACRCPQGSLRAATRRSTVLRQAGGAANGAVVHSPQCPRPAPLTAVLGPAAGGGTARGGPSPSRQRQTSAGSPTSATDALALASWHCCLRHRRLCRVHGDSSPWKSSGWQHSSGGPPHPCRGSRVFSI